MQAAQIAACLRLKEATMNSSVMPTYGRLAVEFAQGKGVWLQDRAGKQYLDAISGVGVCALGHCHPSVSEAICDQANTLIHTSNLYNIDYQEQLAKLLCKTCSMEQVFFGNSGAEANEAAIKLARLYGHNQSVEQPAVLVFEQSFHGRTLATLTASGNRKIQAGFEPLVQGFVRAPFNDIDAVKAIGENNQSIVAVLVEPIQGEGGVNLANDDFLNALHAYCQEKNWLLMLDEVQTGNGRTGKYFAYQHFDWLPDVVTTAKGLGNGLPIGACLSRGKAAGIFKAGNHGSTYGGNPLVCRGALATVNTLINDGVIDNAQQQGSYLLAQLQQKLLPLDIVDKIHGKGLMLGITLKKPCAELVQKALEKGLLINVTAEKTVRLLPPLIISQQEADTLINLLCPLIETFNQNNA